MTSSVSGASSFVRRPHRKGARGTKVEAVAAAAKATGLVAVVVVVVVAGVVVVVVVVATFQEETDSRGVQASGALPQATLPALAHREVVLRVREGVEVEEEEEAGVVEVRHSSPLDGAVVVVVVVCRYFVYIFLQMCKPPPPV